MTKDSLKQLKLCLLLIWLTASSQMAIAQQDIRFGQYVFNGLSVNPAYAGYKEDIYVNSTYRKQWVSFPGSPETGTVSIDGLANLLGNKTVGLGAQITWDRVGPQDIVSFYASYAYRIRLNAEDDRRLSFGLGMGLNQYSIDGNRLSPTDQGDPNLPEGRVSTLKPNANVGVYYYTPSFYVGFSAMDIFPSNIYDNAFAGKNNYDFLVTKKVPHYYLTAGYIFTLSEDFKLQPSIMFKDDLKGPTNVDNNLLLLWADRFWLGGSYRSAIKLWNKDNLQIGLEQKDAVSVMAGFYVTERLRIGYVYDFATSQLDNYQKGSHEISIGFFLFNRKRPERIISPRYF